MTSESTKQQKDKSALYSQWVVAHTNELLRYTRSRVNDDATAEDLVQLTFVSAWETMDRFEGNSSPRTWLYAILKHKLADHYRKVYREGKHVSGKEIADDDLSESLFDDGGIWRSGHRPKAKNDVFGEPESERLERALMQCLETLPVNLRSAVEMKYLLDLKSENIQAELGISETNYWQQVHRAKVKLRSCIEDRIKQGKA